MKKIILFIACIIAVCGCTTKYGNLTVEKSDTHKTITLDLKQDPVSIHETELIKDMDIISLDCEDVFDKIDKIIRYKNRIYIMDKSQTNSVYIFDNSGKHINTVSRQGQGPEEYAQLMDIDIDTANSTLNILSRMDKKLLKFDLDGKRCLGVERTAQPFWTMSKIKNGYIGYAANDIWDIDNPYNVWDISEKQELKTGFFEIDKTWRSIILGGGSVFSRFGDKTYYITPMDFNIYLIKDGKVFVEYTFDLGDDAWPSHLKEFREPDEIRSFIMTKVRRFYYFQETDKWTIVLFLHQGQDKIGLYDKQNDKVCYVRLDVNDSKYFIGFGNIVGIDETAIFAKMDAQNVKRMWTGKDQYNDFWPQHGEQIENLRKKFPVVDEEGNPYLLIYSLK
jgi:hypothetical protein